MWNGLIHKFWENTCSSLVAVLALNSELFKMYQLESKFSFVFHLYLKGQIRTMGIYPMWFRNKENVKLMRTENSCFTTSFYCAQTDRWQPYLWTYIFVHKLGVTCIPIQSIFICLLQSGGGIYIEPIRALYSMYSIAIFLLKMLRTDHKTGTCDTPLATNQSLSSEPI